jgi:hypothetical protein
MVCMLVCDCAVMSAEQMAAAMALTQPQLSQEAVQELLVLQVRLEGITKRMATVAQDALAREEVSQGTSHSGRGIGMAAVLPSHSVRVGSPCPGALRLVVRCGGRTRTSRPHRLPSTTPTGSAKTPGMYVLRP